jgi:hypothetical protein
MRPGSNSAEDHQQLSHKGHPVDGALVVAGSVWPHLHSSAYRVVTYCLTYLHSGPNFLQDMSPRRNPK